ncbi:MAG: PilZ domain-containing protein [Enterobacterales bacterium]|nr:PilZ domain-containing protein [Enterobacterales bacterium]
MTDERRNYQRVSFDATAKLIKDDQIFACQIVDLSIHGVLFKTAWGASL